MYKCVSCHRRVEASERGVDMGSLCYCTHCLIQAEYCGIPITRETAIELIKQAVIDWPLAGEPLPQRVSDDVAQHAAGGMCCLCHFEASADDSMFHGPGGQVVCLRCYRRETSSEKPMSKELRRDLIAILASVEGQ